MMQGDRVEVRCKTSGPTAPWKRGIVIGSPPDWLVQLEDGGHVHPMQIASMRPFGIPIEAQPAELIGAETMAQRQLFHGGNVGSFWGGLAKLANPFSSPLSPIGQVRRTLGAFRGGGGGAAPAAPPSYPQPDPSQQYAAPGYGPQQPDPLQQYAPAQQYAPNAADWSQASSPSAGWPGGGFDPY